MPSTPRFSTPARSVTSSPTAARISGAAARSVATRSASAMRRLIHGRLPGGRGTRMQHVGAEQEEQQHALDDAGGGERDLLR
jgi:hypothetical protein